MHCNSEALDQRPVGEEPVGEEPLGEQPKKMIAVVWQHEAHEGLGIFDEALRHAGFTIQSRFRSVDRTDGDADLLVVLGGAMGVYEVEQHPFLGTEQHILRERLARDRPSLGICLGAQLIAAAANAEVFRGKNGFELGVSPVRWTAEGAADPVIAGVRAKTPVAHWHQDTFRAVQGATLLASTDRYMQQAFRLGSSYAFQFHPELTAEAYGQWLEPEHTEHKQGLSKLHAVEAEWKSLAARLATHFALAAKR